MIVLAVMGRFPTLYLAKYLSETGVPHRLVTSYPKYFTNRLGIPGRSTVTVPEVAVISGLVHRIGSHRVGRHFNPDWVLSEWFDIRARRLLTRGTTLFVGWSGRSLRCLKQAHRLGAKTILERGSAQILEQDDLLRQEYKRFGLPYTSIDQRFIDKELAEYDETDLISVPSTFVWNSFVKRGVAPGKLIKVPYGVNLSQFQPGRKQDKVFRIIQCSRLSLRKGVQYLLQAFTELDLPEAELWLVGAMTPEIRGLMGQYDHPRIILKGHVPFATLIDHYQQSSVFCLPSIEEGLAMVQAQAMACGLPVICTTHTGGEEIIRDGMDGFIIPIRDVEALKEKIQHLYENRDRCKEMGASALERVRSGFSWQDYGDRMVAEYARILNQAQGRI